MSGASRKNGWQVAEEVGEATPYGMNGWQVAEEVGEATPYGMQHVLDRAKWDCDSVRSELCAYVREVLASPVP